MMRRLLLPLLVPLLPLSAEEPILQNHAQALAEKADAFESVPFTADGSPTRFSLELGKTTAPYDGGVFDGFRFRCPEDIKGKDFVWYFNAPESWGNWYIVPMEGEAKSAFKDWLDAVRLYSDFDKASENPRLRVLQSLAGDYFTPGREYIMWFRKASDTKDSPALRGVAAFAPAKKSWDHRDIEEALHLKSSPAAEQVTALGSRGGAILLDERFFVPSYAEERIQNALSNIASAKRLRGGLFITMQTSIPNCATSPSIDEIIRQHGEPDLIRDMAEVSRIRKHADDHAAEDDTAGYTRYYYDHFALEVKTGAKDAKVLRVTTSASDFSTSRPARKGATYASVEFENLIVFRRDGMEVGRAYYFMEGGKTPTFITVPPEGEYHSDANDTLTHQGEGRWIWETRYDNGGTQWKKTFQADRLEGPAEGFYPDGKTSIKGSYRQGQAHGEWVRYDETGKESGRLNYNMGKRVEP